MITVTGFPRIPPTPLRILLIAPACGVWQGIGRYRWFNGRAFRFSMLPLLTVAALSPDDAEITLVDEQVDAIPEGRFDVVGITAMTALAPRAYALCAQFRARGIPVVLGGFHATLNPDEALGHADAVVIGPAYGAWEQVCADLRAGTLQRRYAGSLDGAIPRSLPRHLMKGRQYATVNALFATLGCHNRCRFCSIHVFHQGQRYRRCVEEVAAEAAALPGQFFLFVDDNLAQDKDYLLTLCDALAPLHKRWSTQVSLDTAEDQDLLAAMQRAGCFGVFVGLETLDTVALAQLDKPCNRPARYREAIAAFHRHGMYVEAGVIVGFDTDGPEVFQTTLEVLERLEVDAIQLSILTPLPGTALYGSMQSRIRDWDWSHYDFRHAVFEPRRMSREALQAGADWLIQAFYRPWRILRRVPRWLMIPGGLRRFGYPLALSLAYYGRVHRFGIGGAVPVRKPETAPPYAVQ